MKKKLYKKLLVCYVLLVAIGNYANASEPESVFEAKQEIVKEVQIKLSELGYDCGTPDGIVGNNTRNAILSFQKDNGLYESGVVDYQLLKYLSVEIAETSNSSQAEMEIGTTLSDMPDGMIIDEDEWEAWKSENICALFPFMSAGKEAGYSFTVPSGQANSAHKTVQFIFKDGEHTLEKAEMYYGVENQKIEYTGLNTEDESIFISDEFKEACIRLMLSYNIHYDSGKSEAVLNLTRERAESIVNYCFDNNIEHCLIDDMRIRIIRNSEEKYYGFHMEY